MDLDKELNEIKLYSRDRDTKLLINRIYALDLPEEYLKKLTQNELILIHVKLHNALSYKKPFAPLDQIKIKHDLVAGLLDNHLNIDKLDD